MHKHVGVHVCGVHVEARVLFQGSSFSVLYLCFEAGLSLTLELFHWAKLVGDYAGLALPLSAGVKDLLFMWPKDPNSDFVLAGTTLTKPSFPSPPLS